MGLKAHRFLEILPGLTKPEVEAVTERVRLYGQREAVETVDGEVVSGWGEYQACLALGVKPNITRVPSPACLIEYVCRRNVGRHFSTLDRACIAVLAQEQWKVVALDRKRRGGKLGAERAWKGSGTENPIPFDGERWFEQAARMLGTTAGAVKRLAHLRLHAPDVFEAVRARKLTVLREARDLAHALKSKKARAKVLALRVKHPGVPVGRLVADVMRSERPAIEGSPSERGESWVVYEGSLKQESKRIPDATIDLVHADIIYGSAEMAEDVAKVAKRVLVEDGLLALIAGHQVFDVLNAVAKHLVPVAIGAYHVKGNTKRKWTGPVQRVDSLPVLIFGKAKVRQIAHLAFVSELKEESWHGWQKNVDATTDLIASMTPPGSRVLDPCCGSGTTGVAALAHGCQFVGIDSDKDAVKTSRARLVEAEGRKGRSPVVPLRRKTA